jgi:hypothetical protein
MHLADALILYSGSVPEDHSMLSILLTAISVIFFLISAAYWIEGYFGRPGAHLRSRNVFAVDCLHVMAVGL